MSILYIFIFFYNIHMFFVRKASYSKTFLSLCANSYTCDTRTNFLPVEAKTPRLPRVKAK